MRSKILWTIVFVLAAFYLSGVSDRFGARDHAQVQTRPVWEYKVVSINHPMQERQLNLLGAEGWEVVAVGEESAPADKRFVLKRRKE